MPRPSKSHLIEGQEGTSPGSQLLSLLYIPSQMPSLLLSLPSLKHLWNVKNLRGRKAVSLESFMNLRVLGSSNHDLMMKQHLPPHPIAVSASVQL